jgi:hypothetical protein
VANAVKEKRLKVWINGQERVVIFL